MKIKVCFYSYFKELTGCATTAEEVPDGSRLGDLIDCVVSRFPNLGEMRKAMLVAVGLEYQKPDYALKDGEEVSFFPPVQGG